MFDHEEELDQALSTPSPSFVRAAAQWRGDIVILGAGGKTGGGISVMAQRALRDAGSSGKVFAVSRWTDQPSRARLEANGVRTLTADLSDHAALSQLPDAARVVYLVGTKFGTSTNTGEAWMTNTVLAAAVAERYASSRLAVLSTGNVYPLTRPVDGGSKEGDETGPVGEYAVTCLGRERVMAHAARARDTQIALIRLNYACEPRYGVIADIARRMMGHLPIDLGVGAVNVVWQRYANEVILRCLDMASRSPFVLNLTGPETASVRRIAQLLAEQLGVTPSFTGVESATSLLSNAGRCHSLFGYPDLSLEQLIELQAAWIAKGNAMWDKPTKFERRDGQF